MNKSDFSILVVDDNKMNVDMLSRRLKRDGYIVTTAFNGREALESMRQNLPDMVLLDVMMPVMDGLDVLGVIQGDEEFEKIPVIMVTAKNDREYVDRCLEWGAVDYILKPINMAKLRDVIGQYLN